MKMLNFASAGLLLIAIVEPALAETRLAGTSLYKQTAKGCRPLDLQRWSHPTRRVLEREHIAIDKVELCNNDRYPVFTVHLRYDPNGPNDKYFNRIFWELFMANGRNPYSLVDLDFKVIRGVEASGKNEITVSNDEFSSSEGQ